MKHKQKKIGIWGYGIAGKAVMRHFHAPDTTIEVLDSNTPGVPELAALTKKNIHFLPAGAIDDLFLHNDAVFVSPGIDVRAYKKYHHKLITEVDLFQEHWKKPIIAITGSVGKTTVTHILNQLLPKFGIAPALGGNIGIGMLDLLHDKKTADTALLELSSFQLEHCKTFAPDLAVITNIHPNHLDRHASLDEYAQAKYNIMRRQNKTHNALLPLKLAQQLIDSSFKGTLNIFSTHKPTAHELQNLNYTHLFYINDDALFVNNAQATKKLIDLQSLPSISFTENWLMISAVIYLIGLQIKSLSDINMQNSLPEHRLEFVRTINGIDYYNDSKSTTPASTIAAVHKLKNKPIILLLGGLSKGVDRTPLIKQIKPYVKQIICFGKESQTLLIMCLSFDITAIACPTLEDAVRTAQNSAKSGEQILLSPAGSSFDLFKNYEDRGTTFKQLVTNSNLA